MAEKILGWEQKNINLMGMMIFAVLVGLGVVYVVATGDIIMAGTIVGGGYLAIIAANMVLVAAACLYDKWKERRRTC